MTDAKPHRRSSRTQRVRRRLNDHVYHLILRSLPLAIGKRARGAWLKRSAAAFGDGAWVGQHVVLTGADRLFLGDRASIARGATVDARGSLRIGDDTLIGFESVLVTHTHRSERTDVPIRDQGMYDDAIVIGNDVWIGTRAVILPGVTIGDHTIIGAGAVVAKSLPANVVAAGVPARVLRQRTSDGEPER